MLDRIREVASRHGFQAVAFWPISPLGDELEILQQWLDRGFSGSMGYLTRQASSGMTLDTNTPWARGGVSFLVRWDELHHGSETPWDAYVASYARGLDYHRVVQDRLQAIAAEIGFSRHQVQVDATVLPERALARRAGLGWIGKNRFLTHPRLGGDVCLSELLVDQPLCSVEVEIQQAPCGDCGACMDACPTGALTPHGVDAARCLAYHTTQNRGTIPIELRGLINHILGCDLCLRACPYGKAAGEGGVSDDGFLGRLIASRDRDEFSSLAGRGPLAYVGRRTVVRSAVVVAANRQRDDLVDCIADALCTDPSPLVRAHAAWALGRFDTAVPRLLLKRRHGIEPHSAVREEIAAALS